MFCSGWCWLWSAKERESGPSHWSQGHRSQPPVQTRQAGESKREQSRSETRLREGRLFLQHLTRDQFFLLPRYPGVHRRRRTNWTLFSRINYRCWKKIFSKSGGIVEMQGCCNILHWSQFLRSIARTPRRKKIILETRNINLITQLRLVRCFNDTMFRWRLGVPRKRQEWQWPLFYSLKPSLEIPEGTQTLQSGVELKIERSGWHSAQCGAYSYYKWLYVTHWEHSSQLLFNLIILIQCSQHLSRRNHSTQT